MKCHREIGTTSRHYEGGETRAWISQGGVARIRGEGTARGRTGKEGGKGSNRGGRSYKKNRWEGDLKNNWISWGP